MKTETETDVKTRILVVDLPSSVPAEEATAILNEPLTKGYYLRSATTIGDPMRFFYAARVPDTTCEEELRAIDVTVAHRRETATRIVQVLCKLGIFRSTTWVKRTVDDMS